jgi:hypothetical protein
VLVEVGDSRYYQANPPEEAWDGVWIMEQK